jgi:hypothetical protein
MRFSVMTADETRTYYNGRYEIPGNGVLVIHEQDNEGGTQVTHLSPGFWRQIDETRTRAEGPNVY